MDTPPAANVSAPATTHGSGSSITKSTPALKAVFVRTHLSKQAGSPLCTKFPLIIATI